MKLDIYGLDDAYSKYRANDLFRKVKYKDIKFAQIEQTTKRLRNKFDLDKLKTREVVELD